MVEARSKIDFNANAELRKWPSLGGNRVSQAVHPYLVVDGTLDECIGEFMAKPKASHHLYEIHTAPQAKLTQCCYFCRTHCRTREAARFPLID